MTGSPTWDEMVVVGRIGRPHGLRGHIVVHPETDFVEQRFRPGQAMWSLGEGRPRLLTIESARIQNGRPVITFEGFTRREDVEGLVGLELRVPERELQPLEPGRYYEHHLVGCVVVTAEGVTLGTVIRVEGGPGGSRLVVDGRHGEVLIPLASDICVEIDVASRRIRVEPPEGLLELNETKRSRRRRT